MDLLTYLENYERDDLKQVSNDTFTTKTHDSLRISNGLWNWFSRGVGGRSAVDFIKVRENIKFMDAVRYIFYKTISQELVVFNDYNSKKYEKKDVVLPPKNENCNRAKIYLMKRGIDSQIIEECIANNLIYEEKNYHNVVFVGYDENKKARYAFVRGTNETRFMKEAKGSDKNYTFRLNSLAKSNRLHLFESSIDLLSYATLMKMKNLDFHSENLLSLAGVFKPSKDKKELKIPQVLEKYLRENHSIKNIYLHLDNDETGKMASENLIKNLSKNYKIINKPVPKGKDCNDYLCLILGIRNFNKTTNENDKKLTKLCKDKNGVEVGNEG